MSKLLLVLVVALALMATVVQGMDRNTCLRDCANRSQTADQCKCKGKFAWAAVTDAGYADEQRCFKVCDQSCIDYCTATFPAMAAPVAPAAPVKPVAPAKPAAPVKPVAPKAPRKDTTGYTKTCTIANIKANPSLEMPCTCTAAKMKDNKSLTTACNRWKALASTTTTVKF